MARFNGFPRPRYRIAVLALLAAFFARWLLEPVLGAVGRPFVLLTPAVAISAWYGGLRPGLFSTVLGTCVVVYFLMPPIHRLAISDPTDLERLSVFLLEGVLISGLCELLHRARRRSDATAAALADEIRQREKLEEELRRRAAELAHADEAKDQFLAMLAHELRNPLAPMRNALELIKRLGPLEARLVRAWEILDRQLQYQTRIIDDLLDVSRISRGKIGLRQRTLDLVRLVRDTVQDNRSVMEDAGLRLSLELPEQPLWVTGDATRLAQALGNLLHNAAKFTDFGGRVTVGLQLDSATARAVVTVRDTGIGIEPAMLPRVFDTFAQADRTLERSRGGLGLGLALVKGLAELHGGEVAAESSGPGGGAAFTLYLPTIPAPAAAPALSHARARPLGPLRILIVEDHRDAAETLRAVLELSGCTVEVAFSGPEALEAAAAFRPEVVICDLGLPGMDGYQVAAVLRQTPQAATVRLIAVSGYGQEEDRRRSLAAGFDQHLTKPIDFAELRQLLEDIPVHSSAPTK